jgi:hypothetical protein
VSGAGFINETGVNGVNNAFIYVPVSNATTSGFDAANKTLVFVDNSTLAVTGNVTGVPGCIGIGSVNATANTFNPCLPFAPPLTVALPAGVPVTVDAFTASAIGRAPITVASIGIILAPATFTPTSNETITVRITDARGGFFDRLVTVAILNGPLPFPKITTSSLVGPVPLFAQPQANVTASFVPPVPGLSVTATGVLQFNANTYLSVAATHRSTSCTPTPTSASTANRPARRRLCSASRLWCSPVL